MDGWESGYIADSVKRETAAVDEPKGHRYKV